MTIRHCVLFSFKEQVEEADRFSIYDDLAALQEQVDGYESFVSGPNTSFEHMERGFTDGFIITFRDRKAHMDYHELPGHKDAGARLCKIVKGGVHGILVFDFEG